MNQESEKRKHVIKTIYPSSRIALGIGGAVFLVLAAVIIYQHYLTDIQVKMNTEVALVEEQKVDELEKLVSKIEDKLDSVEVVMEKKSASVDEQVENKFDHLNSEVAMLKSEIYATKTELAEKTKAKVKKETKELDEAKTEVVQELEKTATEVKMAVDEFIDESLASK